ncbi:MAG: carboxypeptidase regulatory-like domain-containing protein [Gemmatimonadaceae bacterium]
MFAAGLATGLAVICSATPAAAQNASSAREAFGAIDGMVVDSAGQGIPGVEVFLFGGKRGVRTSAAGAYRIDSVKTGPHIVRFRRFGLIPATLGAPVTANAVTGIDVVMYMMLHTLEMVVIQDTDGENIRLPKGFLERQRNGMGRYVTAADIERHHIINTSDMLRRMAGVSVSRNGAILNARGTTSILNKDCLGTPMPVYLDGAIASGDDIDLIPPSDIAGMEVYLGPATLPFELRGKTATCGAVVVWTKQS